MKNLNVKSLNTEEFSLTDEELTVISEASREDLVESAGEYSAKARESGAAAPDEALLKKLDKYDVDYRRKKKKALRHSLLRIAAIFLLCIGVLSGLDVNSSEGIDFKELGVLKGLEEDSVPLPTEESAAEKEESIKDWRDYWYPEYMPEGFLLFDVYDDDIVELKYTDFLSIEQDAMITIESSIPGVYSIGLDREHTQREKINIGDYEGTFYFSKEYNYCGVYWEIEEYLICIDTTNYINKEEILKIAESMAYRE